MHWNDEPGRTSRESLDCGELVKTLDFVTLTYMQGAKEAPQITRELFHDSGPLTRIDSPKGRHWLWLCSAKPGPSWWVPARIELRKDGFVIPVMARDNLDARVHFPRELCSAGTDLGYPDIGNLFAQLGQAAEVAQETLERVKGNFRNSFKAYDGFIDAVIVLMFGVEAGRNWTTCATSLMLLELIAGKHPCASQGNKPLTMAAAFHGEAGTRSLADIHRQLRTVRHWLDLSELQDGYNQLSVKGRILKLLQTYLA